ncbi:Protoporphyrinogen oxidase [Exophiala dermatitidis]
MRLGGRNALLSHAVKPWSRSRATATAAHLRLQSRSYSTPPPSIVGNAPLRDLPNPNAKSVAILGGGITGLAAAWNLQRNIPGVKVIIYEKSHVLGGWVQSERIPVQDGHILFEWGPRTLRPALSSLSGAATVDLIAQLGIVDSLVPIAKDSPAAANRFIYYPDHPVVMPGPGLGLWGLISRLLKLRREPIFNGVLQGLLVEPYVAPRNPSVKDESVGDFLARRFGKPLADNFASAFFQGIYAGDIYKLSARTTLPLLWHLEGRYTENEVGVLLQFAALRYQGRALIPKTDAFFTDLYARTEAAAASVARESYTSMKALALMLLRQASVYTFTDGLSKMTVALADRLSDSPNVELRTSSPVDDVTYDKKKAKVSVRSGNRIDNFDYVVSTLGPGMTNKFLSSTASTRGAALEPQVTKACERNDKGVTVMVVNLYYPTPDMLPQYIRGFGYLIPRTVPLEENPERALGVIFGSETSGRPDTLVYPLRHDGTKAQDTGPGTKITVMLGGHWWDGWAPSDLPSEEQAIEMAKELLLRHLGVDGYPEVAKAQLNRNCIPQYPVGYRDDMATIHKSLMCEFDGRFKVAGPWWQGGVGMGDSIRKAREVSWMIEQQWDDRTGLEHYDGEDEWYVWDSNAKQLVKDPAT